RSPAASALRRSLGSPHVGKRLRPGGANVRLRPFLRGWRPGRLRDERGLLRFGGRWRPSRLRDELRLGGFGHGWWSGQLRAELWRRGLLEHGAAGRGLLRSSGPPLPLLPLALRARPPMPLV